MARQDIGDNYLVLYKCIIKSHVLRSFRFQLLIILAKKPMIKKSILEPVMIPL